MWSWNKPSSCVDFDATLGHEASSEGRMLRDTMINYIRLHLYNDCLYNCEMAEVNSRQSSLIYESKLFDIL